MIVQMDERYPSAQERQELLNYLSTARKRRNAVEEIRKVSGFVADDVVKGMRQLYPDLEKYKKFAFDKIQRDVQLLTHLTAHSMFLGESETIDDQFLIWFYTIFRAAKFTPLFVADALRIWLDGLEKRLSPDAFALYRPFAEHVVDVLTQIPDPAVPMVGPRVSAG
jgi:hypothetical protein